MKPPMLHKIKHSRSGGVLHGARPGWLTASGFTLERGGSSAVSRGLAGRPDHD